MKRFGKWTASAAVAAILVIGVVAPAAVAGGSIGVSTMRPFSDASWTPGTTGSGVRTMQPFSDASWTPGTTGVVSMRPFSDASWTPGTTGVLSMRPFSDPNAIGHVPAVTAAVSHAGDGSSAGARIGLTAGLIAGLLLLVAAAGYASRQRRARPA